MDDKKINRNTIILLISIFVTLSLVIIGVTYAYFSAIVLGNETASSMYVRGTNLEITYNETKNIESTDITPNWSSTKVFSVTNTGEEDTSYGIYWGNVVNTLVNKQYLVYTIVGTGNNAYTNNNEVQFPSTSGDYIATNIPIKSGETHNYVLTLKYINDVSYDQSDDMGTNFSASVEIETYEITN